MGFAKARAEGHARNDSAAEGRTQSQPWARENDSMGRGTDARRLEVALSRREERESCAEGGTGGRAGAPTNQHWR
jgi:hypothetical protein